MSSTDFYFQRALIIDDSEIDVLVNRRLMQLTRFAEDIMVTTNGEEAIRILKEECATAEHAPDWIFLDMHLPGMSGYDFIEEFKQLPEYITKKTKIMVLSVFNKPEHIKKIFENCFVAGQIEKPLTQQALKDIAHQKAVGVVGSL
jgi:CheY-like chemotaxis protein